MKTRFRKPTVAAGVFLCIFFFITTASAVTAPQGSTQKGPLEVQAPHPSLQVKEPDYNFGQVQEGTEVEHEFTVSNTGNAVLNIERVRVSWGCTVVRYDPAIPPGGEGKIIMKVNLKNYQGKVSKTATIQSNDPHNPELTVKVEGTVLAIIDIKPSANILFRGMADQLSESVVDLMGSTMPFHISGIETNLNESINYSLETVVEGKEYKLKVSNKVLNGTYGGFVRLNTDLTQKPEIIIRVSGFVEGEITAKPQNILIGRLCAGQPERVGRVVVVSNRNRPFEITRLTYDPDLMTVSQETLENETGFVLDIQPKLESVPVGSRKQTTLKIETDLSPAEKVEVLVNVLNHSDQPEAQHKWMGVDIGPRKDS